MTYYLYCLQVGEFVRLMFHQQPLRKAKSPCTSPTSKAVWKCTPRRRRSPRKLTPARCADDLVDATGPASVTTAAMIRCPCGLPDVPFVNAPVVGSPVSTPFPASGDSSGNGRGNRRSCRSEVKCALAGSQRASLRGSHVSTPVGGKHGQGEEGVWVMGRLLRVWREAEGGLRVRFSRAHCVIPVMGSASGPYSSIITSCEAVVDTSAASIQRKCCIVQSAIYKELAYATRETDLLCCVVESNLSQETSLG